MGLCALGHAALDGADAGIEIGGTIIMSKRTRQIVGIFAAIVAYYIIHEGAHLLYAL